MTYVGKVACCIDISGLYRTSVPVQGCTFPLFYFRFPFSVLFHQYRILWDLPNPQQIMGNKLFSNCCWRRNNKQNLFIVYLTVGYLWKHSPLRSGTKENLQMYRVSPCYKRKPASPVRNVLICTAFYMGMSFFYFSVWLGSLFMRSCNSWWCFWRSVLVNKYSHCLVLCYETRL